MTPAHRPTVAVVDLDAVRHNVRVLTPPGSAVMAVVKADGYGHGAAPVARAALDAGASWLGVALVEEGIELREAGFDCPIMVLSEFPPGSEKEALSHHLTPALYTDRGLAGVADAAASLHVEVPVHVKVDTGMHRVGLPLEEVVEFVRRSVGAGLRFEGLWTHFAMADDPEDPFTRRQLERLLEAARELAGHGMRPRYLHAANTAATMALPETHLDLVRPGLGIYGLSPGPAPTDGSDLRPALAWTSEVAMVKRVGAGEGVSYGLRYRPERDTTIATVPVGYADGYPRLLSNRGQVLIGGRRHPVAGTVCMDQIMVDCGGAVVRPGDEVILVGRRGEAEIGVDEVAAWAETISYEVLCGVSRRVPRRYVGER